MNRIQPQDARQGRSRGRVLRVLIASLALAAIVGVIALSAFDEQPTSTDIGTTAE